MTEHQIKMIIAIGKLGCVTKRQLKNLFCPLPPTTFKRTFNGVKRHKLVMRTADSFSNLDIFQLSRNGYQFLFGNDDVRIPALRPTDILHSVLVTQVLIRLLHYEFVAGFTPEHELTPTRLKTFIFERRPDAIIRIKNNISSFEMALEVERALKSPSRINSILDRYEQTFLRKLNCKGLILCASDKYIFNAYQTEIKKRPANFDKQVLLTDLQGIEKLNLNVYGRIIPRVDFRRAFGGLPDHIEIDKIKYKGDRS